MIQYIYNENDEEFIVINGKEYASNDFEDMETYLAETNIITEEFLSNFDTEYLVWFMWFPHVGTMNSTPIQIKKNRMAVGHYLIEKIGKFSFLNMASNLPYPKNEMIKEANREFFEQLTGVKKVRIKKYSSPVLDTVGFVYLLLLENGLCKIGKTKNIEKRLTPFKVSFPMKWEMLHHFKSNNYSSAENCLHNEFRKKRDVGEFFNLSKRDIDYITAIKDFEL